MNEPVKKVTIHYFKSTGEFYDTDERLLPLEWSYDYMLSVLLERRKYATMDMVILDGGDGKHPYIKPYMGKAQQNTGKKGFFG